jgi:hypothetical protein
MLKPLGKKVSDVDVVERVIGDLPVFSVFDQVEISQDTELMGDGGLGLPEQTGQITNAQFILRKGIEDLGTGRIPKDLKCLGQFLNHPVRLHHLSNSINLLLVDAKDLARVLFTLSSHLQSFHMNICSYNNFEINPCQGFY